MLTILFKGGLLMWLISFIGLVGLAVFLERLFHFHRAQINVTDFVNGIRNSLRRGNTSEAIATCDETPGPVAQIVRTAIAHRALGREELREAIQDVARTEIARLERNLTLLATVAQVTPLLGFLGTVWGMIDIFRVMEKTQLATPGQLAGGVWVALLTTAGGLTVAIPAYIAYNYLVMRVQRQVLDMEKAANEIAGVHTTRSEAVEPEVPIRLAGQQPS